MLMLKLYELRIGNFVETELPSTRQKRIKKVSEIKQKHVLLDRAWYHLDKLIPIPITEKILLKCGFEKFKWITETNVFKHGDLNCTLDENGLQVFGAAFNNLKPVKYLHELQNLYYDLMENELEIDFDKDEQPELPTIVVHPDVFKNIAEKLAAFENDPEFRRKRAEILARKKLEWRAREADRKLVG